VLLQLQSADAQLRCHQSAMPRPYEHSRAMNSDALAWNSHILVYDLIDLNSLAKLVTANSRHKSQSNFSSAPATGILCYRQNTAFGIFVEFLPNIATLVTCSLTLFAVRGCLTDQLWVLIAYARRRSERLKNFISAATCIVG